MSEVIAYLSVNASPVQPTIQYPAYDEAGRLLERVDGNGVHTTYLYNDPEGQVTDIQYPAALEKNVHYTYDNYGRRLSMTDATGTSFLIYCIATAGAAATETVACGGL